MSLLEEDEDENNTCPFIEIQNCINFRSVCPDSIEGAPNLPLRLYRSSRPDLLNQQEVDYFLKDLNIKCILDMRSTTEYKRASGDKLLDQYFRICKVKRKTKFVIFFYFEFTFNSEVTFFVWRWSSLIYLFICFFFLFVIYFFFYVKNVQW